MDISADYLLFDFLVAGTYQPLSGSPVSLSKIKIYPTEKRQDDLQELTLPAQGTRFCLFVGDLGATVPQANASLTVGGATYTIDSVELASANTRYIVKATKTV